MRLGLHPGAPHRQHGVQVNAKALDRPHNLEWVIESAVQKEVESWNSE
jgi:hypothetical protein